jgi:hypothetical protein
MPVVGFLHYASAETFSKALDGLVDSISRPKANLTGVTSISPMTAGKRLELT